MSRSRFGKSTLSGLIDSDSEEESQFLEAMPTPDSATENRGVAKKGRGRPKLPPAKVAKAKAPARRLSGRLIAKGKAAEPAQPQTKTKRKILGDRANHQLADDREEADEFGQDGDVEMGDELDATELEVMENNAPAPKNKVTSGRGVIKKKASAKRTAAMEKAIERVVLETQVPEAEIANNQGKGETERPIGKRVHQVTRSRERSHPRQPLQQRRRAGSASDIERADPVLRRKLGDMTKKYEAANLKYQDVRELGLKEAERNFEQLKRQSDEKTAASAKLIASLKNDVVVHSSSTKESRELKKKVQTQTTEITNLQTQISRLNASVAQIQSENKTLSAKLAASRAAAAETASKAPGTAVKLNGVSRMMGGDVTASLKENLYRDLTGLLMMGVKPDAEDDVFDCIQTGRNGTLHFKLAVTNDKSAESYEDATCSYIPQLDPSRDKDLIEMLPDYLVEEISFPRPQAARFYARVGKALTEQA